jgi:hypothetical protein
MRNRIVSRNVVLAVSALLVFVLMVSPITAVDYYMSHSYEEHYVVWVNTNWIIVHDVPIPVPWPCIGTLTVSVFLWWYWSWGIQIFAANWLAYAEFRGNDFPFLVPCYATYFRMVVEEYAAMTRYPYTFSEEHVWEFPDEGTVGSMVHLVHYMDGSVSKRCMGASVEVSLHVHITSVFGDTESSLSTTAYAP